MSICIALTTLGCKANWSDTEGLSQALTKLGAKIVDVNEAAQVYVVNTCAVTAVAVQQSRQLLRKLKRRSPDALIVATGCVGAVDAAELEATGVVDRVFGTSDRKELIAYVMGFAGVKEADVLIKELIPSEKQSRARAFLKVQDGCERFCAYCIVPSARGRCKSVPISEVVEACKKLSKHHREIILSGVDISQYGVDTGSSLHELIGAIVSSEDVSRVRISSIHPTVVDKGFVELLSSSRRICRHVHLSIQSACDAVLTRMGRGYGGKDVASAIEMLTSRVDDIAVTGDLIAGFPAESEEEHRTTVELISSSRMAGLHVFPFSPRYGTKAYEMEGRVDKITVKRRAAELRQIGDDLRKKFLVNLIGKEFDVIVTSKRAVKKTVEAFSDNGVSMKLPSQKVRYQQMAKARVISAKGKEVIAEWC